MIARRETLEPVRDTLAMLDFGALVSGAAKLRPGRVAFCDLAGDPVRSLTFAELEACCLRIAQSWRTMGLSPGERLLVIATPSVPCLVAIFGALRAGLDVALCGPQLAIEDIAQMANETDAAALAADPDCEGIDINEIMFRAAAKAERIRLVAALSPECEDGAVALDPLACGPLLNIDIQSTGAQAHLITRDIDGRLHAHRQGTVVAAALDFVARVQIGTQTPLVSTILPASFAGLATGPAATLIAGTPLVLHGPFDTQKLGTVLDALKPVHFLAPVMLSEDFAASGLIDSKFLVSLTLLSRFREMPADLPEDPPGGPIITHVPIIDLYGIGEIAAIAERRDGEGRRVAPLAAQHLLDFDGRDVVAARRKLHYLAARGRLDAVVAIEGAAVSQGDADDQQGQRSQ